jgi:hypothetical protein
VLPPLGRGNSLAVGSLRYDLVYLHDVDLLRARKRMAARLVPFAFSGSQAVTAQRLAEKLGDQLLGNPGVDGGR